MKKRYLGILAGLILGIASSLIQRIAQINALTLLMKPWAALGRLLRGWSLSGASGNAAAWTVVVFLSLLPVVCILIARRKKKLPGDWLWLLTAAGAFSGLFLLINPTRSLHPMLAQSILESSPDLAAMGPTALMGSLLILSLLTRWAYGLSERRLIRWAQAILAGSMALIAFTMGMTLTENAVSLIVPQTAADPFRTTPLIAETVQPTASGASLLLEVIALIPSLFLLRMLNAALTLISSLANGWFTEEAESNAALMAARARQTLIAAAGCTAARNILILMLSQVITDASFLLELPVAELLISCAAMLIAGMLKAACRVKRDNDLMI